MVKKIVRSICHWSMMIFVTVVFTFFAWGLIGYFVFEMVALGPRFGPTVVATAITSAFVVLVSAPFVIRVSASSEQRGEQFNSWSRRNAKKLIVGGVAVILLLFAIGMGSSVYEWFSRANHAASALQRFELVGSPEVQSDRVEYMLAKFERAHHRLEGNWLIPETSLPISLRFFSDIREYHSMEPDWSGAALWCQGTSITIYIPLEEVPEVFSDDEESHTPLHEMVHAMICQSIGREAFHSIPRWFHEGLAEFYEYEASSRSSRVSHRFYVWVNRGELMKPERFCNYLPYNGRAEIALFYATAGEFMRSLAAGHGADALNTVIEDVGARMAFEDSLRNHFGGTCTDLYSEWSRSL